MQPEEIVIPQELRPQDGRFGSGPSRVRPEALAALHETGAAYLGHSHRREVVLAMVRRLRDGLSALYSPPDGYEVVLGVGGAAVFWDAMAFSLIERKSQHLVFGEFSSKCADAVARAPHLSEPEVISSEAGAHPVAVAREGVDLYALTQSETSTGVAMPVRRISSEAIHAVDAVSAAAGMRVDMTECDAYYLSPQKGFGSDGGLWVALCSPAAVERIERIASSGRQIPPSLDLKIALESSRRDQTYNTPSLATIFLMVGQIEWILANGGLSWSCARCERSADILYSWAERSPVAMPFVWDPSKRSHTVGTIDFVESVEAKTVAAALRANGIVDTEPYRKLGRNQLRIGLYPAVEPADVERLTRSIDYIVAALYS